jgi:hypothetical protein
MARRSRPKERSAVLGIVKDEPPAAVAQGAILDGTCARRSACVAGRDEGMAVAVKQRNRTLKKD